MAEERKLTGILEIVDRASAKVSKVSGELDAYRGRTEKLSQVSATAAAAGNKLGMAGLVIAGGIGYAAMRYASFDQAMKKTEAVMRETPEAMEGLSKVARQLGRDTSFSATEAAEAFYMLGSKGYKAADATNLIKPILEVAGALDTDLAPATATVTAVMKSYKFASGDVSRVTNTMAAAYANSDATFNKLSEGYKKAVPVTAMLGTSIEDTTALLSELYNAGLEGSEAGTALRGAFVRLLNPTAKVAAILGKAGIKQEEVAGLLKDPVQLIKRLAGANLSAADSAALWGQRAMVFQTIIRNGPEAFRKMQQSVTGTTAATDQYADILEGGKMKIKIFLSSLEALIFAYVEYLYPAIKRVVDLGTRFLNWLGDLPGPLRTVFSWLTVGAMGFLLFAAGVLKLIAGRDRLLLFLGELKIMLASVSKWICGLDIMTLHWVVAIGAAVVMFLLLTDAIETAKLMWHSWHYRKAIAKREEKYQELYAKGYRGKELSEKLGPAIAPPEKRESIMEKLERYKKAIFEPEEGAPLIPPPVGKKGFAAQTMGTPGAQQTIINIQAPTARQGLDVAYRETTKRGLGYLPAT